MITLQAKTLTWLNTLEDNLNSDALAKPRVVVVGTCYSGGFIPQLSAPKRPEAKRLIVTRGTDPALGARPLRRAIDTALVAPLSRLIASRSLTPEMREALHAERGSMG